MRCLAYLATGAGFGWRYFGWEWPLDHINKDN
jgi:hypothetical protein